MEHWEWRGASLVGFSQGLELRLLIALQDALKPQALEVIQWLLSHGYHVELMSGDGERAISFFPECSDVIHAQRFRESVDCDEESFKLGLSAYVNCSIESWDLDEISDGEASLPESCKLKPREKYEKMWMKDDIEKIRNMMELMEDIEYVDIK